MSKKLSRKEIAELGIYDFLGYIGAFESPYIGGYEGTLKLLKQLQIPHQKDYHVLEVGCAAGFASCKLAQEKGCNVTGIDISEVLITKAQERAEKMGLSNVHFQAADATNLPFEDNSFDAVYGIAIVALLPDKIGAFKELMRVVKPRGVIGTLDLFAKNGVNREVLDAFSNTMTSILGVDVTILDIEQWKDIFHRTGLQDIDINETYTDVLVVTRGRSGTAKTTLKMLYHMLINGTVRKKMMNVLRLQRTATMTSNGGFENLGYLLFTGHKDDITVSWT